MNDSLLRLIDESATPEAERRLLEAGSDVGPPPGAKAEVWAALAGQLPPAAPPGAEAVGTAAKTGLWKTVSVGFACGLLVAGGALVLDPAREPAIDALSPPPAVAQQSAPVAASSEPQLTEPGAPLAEPSPEPPARAQRTGVRKPSALTPPATAPEPAESETNAAEPTTRASQLADESRRLREARAALRAGNAAQALSLLEKSRTEHPSMVLGQEHEALVIESLAASGSRAAAKQRARAFIARHPSSPHAAKLRAIAESP